MITPRIKSRLLPNALSLAAVIISSTYSWQALGDETSMPVKLSTSKMSSSSFSPNRSKKDTTCILPLTAPCNGRVRELTYNESSVYVIRTKFGYQTNIIFDKREEIQSISVGDRSLWQIIPVKNRVYIRPMNENLATNMTLITNKRSYEFDIKSVGKRNQSNIYVARFKYPSKHKVKTPDRMEYSRDKADSTKLTTNHPSALMTPSFARPNYSYTYSGPDELAPLQVYDDGHSTFIKYQTIDQAIPNAFAIGQNGKEHPISVTIKGTSLIIDGVTGELALRSSGGEIRVYNESLSQR